MKNELDYYLEWNPRFWEAPFLFGLSHVGRELAGKKVLEIGPRRGRMCAWFAEQGATVVGGDLRLHYLTEAAAESRKNGPPTFSLVQLNGEVLPFRDGSFDVVFTKSVFVFFDRPAALREMLRVLKPGGYVWLVENMKRNPFAVLTRFARKVLGHEWIQRVSFLTLGEVASYAPLFSAFSHAEYHVATPVLHVVPLPRAWLRRLVNLEHSALRRLPFLARFAWLTCIVGRK
ncbi:MAG TPA: class I SAM-dependent methyltransferase [bacterium]|nr:class I SAM-dependent methyltransferase [bacterium]